MTEKPCYEQRYVRMYGHRVTRRKFIIEWYLAAGISFALALGVVVTAMQNPSDWQIGLMGLGTFIISMCYRVWRMNINGYEHEQHDPDINTQLFPWKFK